MGMYNFNPDDPSAGVFGTGSAQHVAQLWKNNIGDTPQPCPYNLKKTNICYIFWKLKLEKLT